MDIEIRRALPEEAEVLTQIAIAAKGHWGYPERWMQIWTPELTFDSGYFEKNESWTAGVENHPVGFHTLLEKDGIAWLENLWVIPSQMRHGDGNALFKHALHLSKQRGYHVLRLESDPNAVGFYEEMGVYKIDQRDYDMEGTPRILPMMELKL
ncbi:MAG: GNAT family N-acetyltransferase [Anaerolineales bacterium]